jgi:S1-C subfamily serine protease
VEGMFSSAINKKSVNNIKVIGIEEKNIFSINGEVQYSTEKMKNFGNNVGFVISGKSSVTVDKLICKEMDFKSGGGKGSDATSKEDFDIRASGSGLIFSSSGYIVTNNHVIADAHKILVEMVSGGTSQSFSATVVQKDVDNDLAILKINDAAFKQLDPLPFAFKETGSMDVGASVFTIGFPMALGGMGKEAKFTDGKISSKTGYNNAINTYQTSIPVQPGNSGSPLFNDKGQLIGVINSTVSGTDNVSYAIKLNYLKNLIDLLSETVELPNNQSLNNVTIEEKVKALSKYVVLIKIK